MQSNSPQPLPPWLLLSVGFLLGHTSQSPSLLESFYSFVDNTLVPAYTSFVLLYIGLLILKEWTGPSFPRKVSSSKATPTESEVGVLEDEEGADEEQPVDMNGKFKLISLENFDAFLEVQGVPWALRRMACRARPIHVFTHRGKKLNIRIEGIIVTQTTYTIDGPPVEVNIRGRVFEDRLTYLEDGKGIRGIKTALTENYDVFIDRELSEDKQKITLTSRAVFKDGRKPVESIQIFERIQ